ncbi:MAG: tRNA 2-thiouridine(34) synthase MnmA [Brevinematia bacterium]
MTVYVGMSGGIDSSVAALLLKEKGFNVKGITLILSGVEGERKCCSLDEVKYAEYVCKYLGIEHEIANVQDLFRLKIINPFIKEYMKGRTPNPCVNCNFYFKFGYMLEYALSKGADLVATGHYARISKLGDTFLLMEALDKIKDQSYFLSRLNKFQLSRIVFPLDSLTKEEVKSIARDSNLPLKPNVRESQDLCFIPGNDINAFLLANGINRKEGIIVDESGNIVGKHEGVHFYTIGQRRGLNVQMGRKVYVKYKDVNNNKIIVSDNPYSKTFVGKSLNWIWYKPPQDGDFVVKIRYRNSGDLANVKIIDKDKVKVSFYKEQFGITPGQLAVFYDGEVVVGSAFIDDVLD